MSHNATRKKKNAKITDLISFAELARRARVSRPAISAWIKQQEAQGIVLAVPIGRRGKFVDANSKLIANYISNATGKSQRAAQTGKKTNAKSSSDYLRKLGWQAEKMRLQNNIMRKKYVERDAVYACLDEQFRLETLLYKAYPEKVLRRIEQEFGFSAPREKRERAKKLIKEFLQNANETNRRIIADFKKTTA